jgi:hypothetical protein
MYKKERVQVPRYRVVKELATCNETRKRGGNKNENHLDQKNQTWNKER